MINVYKIKNGILEKDGKKIFTVGQSYYPSFHEAKYPGPPDGDRIGEMKKDIKAMKEMGFNHIRFAAIGKIYLDDKGEVVVDTPFVDAMIEECEKNDISVSVRLQGYSVNLRGFKNVLMINNEGKEQGTHWSNFIRTIMAHEGLLEDNRLYSEKVSEHFAKFKNVVGLQIYNEPHYPSNEVYDYHENTIEAYRKWLIEKNIMTEDAASVYQPPRSRREQEPHMWILWRIFIQEIHMNFLDNAAYPANETTGLPTFTCFTSCQGSPSIALQGVDVFRNARGPMDILGYTVYIHGSGNDYYSMCYFLDMCATAANAVNKETWCVELDSRTYIPSDVYNKNTFATIGSGAKAIIYYQWRGDYPSEATPIPNGCGLVNYDGTKAPNYDNAAIMTKYINGVSELITNAKRNSDHIAVFHSDHGAFFADYKDNYNEYTNYIRTVHKHPSNTRNSYVDKCTLIYTELRKLGYGVDFTDAINLRTNNLKTKYLFLPDSELLSEDDLKAIEEFISKGGKVFELSPIRATGNVGYGYTPYNEERLITTYTGQTTGLYTLSYCIEDLKEDYLETPVSVSSNPLVKNQNLISDDYELVVLTNISVKNKPQSTELTLNHNVKSAVMYDCDGERNLEITDNKIIIDEIKDGCIIKINKQNID